MKKREKAFDKFCNKQAENHSVFWTGVLMGNHPATVEPSDYDVKMETFAKQARKEGFKTSKWSDESLQIYR